MSIFVERAHRELCELWDRVHDLKKDRDIDLYVAHCNKPTHFLKELFCNRYMIIIHKQDKSQGDDDLKITNLSFNAACYLLSGIAIGHVYKSLQELNDE